MAFDETVEYTLVVDDIGDTKITIRSTDLESAEKLLEIIKKAIS